MRYEAFHFSNFRGIKNAQLNLCPHGKNARVFTFVGLNECGKTTLLEAIDYFSPGNSETDLGPKQLAGWVGPEPHELIPISERANFNDQVIVRAIVSLDDADVEAIKKGVKKRCGFRISELRRSIEITIALHFKDSIFINRQSLWPSTLGEGMLPTGYVIRLIQGSSMPAWSAVVKEIQKRLPRIWYFPNFLFEFPDRIVLSPTEHESRINRFYRILFQDILDSLGKGLVVDKHVTQRARSESPSDTVNLRQLLREASRDVSKNIVAAWGKLFQSSDLSEKRINIECFTNKISGDDTGEQEVFIKFFLEDSDGEFEIRERSQGFRWFFVYLLLITYRGKRQGGESGTLFLFDEPASNLHPRAQAAMLNSLGRLSDEAFVIYTTHSHHMINPAWLGATYVVTNEGGDPREISSDATVRRTNICVREFHDFAAQHPARSYYFQPILDVLEYSPSQLELVPQAIFVEGKSDYYLLRYYQEVYSEISEAEHLSILPGTGSGSLTTVIQLYLAWARPFLILLDSDKAGDREGDRYLERFGPVLNGRIVGLNRATGGNNIKSLESLVDQEDLLRFQCIVDPSVTVYRKKLFNLGIQEAFSARIPIQLSPFAVSNLSTAIRNLRLWLTKLDASQTGRPGTA